VAGTRIELTLDDRELAGVPAQLIHAAADLRAPFNQFGDYLDRVTRDRFDAQEAPDGTPWAELRDSTIEHKSKNEDLILVLDGYLRDTLDHQETSDSFAFGTDRLYGAAQQFGMPQGYAGRTSRGAPIPWGDIPPRPYLGLSADDRRELLAILRDYLAGAV